MSYSRLVANTATHLSRMKSSLRWEINTIQVISFVPGVVMYLPLSMIINDSHLALQRPLSFETSTLGANVVTKINMLPSVPSVVNQFWMKF